MVEETATFDEKNESRIKSEDQYESPTAVDWGDVVDLTLGSTGATPDGSAFTTWGSF